MVGTSQRERTASNSPKDHRKIISSTQHVTLHKTTRVPIFHAWANGTADPDIGRPFSDDVWRGLFPSQRFASPLFIQDKQHKIGSLSQPKKSTSSRPKQGEFKIMQREKRTNRPRPDSSVDTADDIAQQPNRTPAPSLQGQRESEPSHPPPFHTELLQVSPPDKTVE